MKNLFLIGGTMGVGKTTACQILKRKLRNSVLLDGDWCWDMHPFLVIEETKKMVMNNICFLLNSFLRCSVYENIIFCWVMHEQAIVDEIIARLDLSDCAYFPVSLVCGKEALQARLQLDVNAGIRDEEAILRSVDRIPLYEKLDTCKIDVTGISPEETADLIIRRCETSISDS